MGLPAYLAGIIAQIVGWMPSIIKAAAILIIGWAAGRVFGKAVSLALDKIGVDDALRQTSVGKAIEARAKISLVSVFDVIARWFV